MIAGRIKEGWKQANLMQSGGDMTGKVVFGVFFRSLKSQTRLTMLESNEGGNPARSKRPISGS